MFGEVVFVVGDLFGGKVGAVGIVLSITEEIEVKSVVGTFD